MINPTNSASNNELIQFHQQNFEQSIKTFSDFTEKNPSYSISLSHQITTRLHAAFEEMTQSYFFLKKQPLISVETHKYETTKKLIKILQEHRILLDSEAIQRKLENKLTMAENNCIRTREIIEKMYPQAAPFSSLQVPKALDFQESFLELNISTPKLTQVTKAELAAAQINSMSRLLPIVDNLTCATGRAQALGEKKQQEDTILTTSFYLINSDNIKHKFLLTGVFDGHGGTQAALYVQSMLSEKLQEKLRTISKEIEGNINLTDRVIWNSLKLSCVELSDESNKITTWPGTTASFSLLKDGEDLWTANVGDSRSFITSGERVFQLSEDMTVQFNFPENTSKEEFNTLKETLCSAQSLTSTCYEKSIWKRGGFTENLRVNNNLAPARAIGDAVVGSGLSARPKITKISLSEKFPREDVCFLVHGSDGLFDRATTHQIAEAVWQNKAEDPEKIAANIVYSSLIADGFDNTSVVVVKFDLSALRNLKDSLLSLKEKQCT